MRATAQPIEGNKVKLSVELDESELDEALNLAYRRLGQEVRVPGFRPGKVPRRLLEARMGAGAIRTEVVRETLPDYYARAVQENQVDAIAAPTIDITAGEESGPLAFEAVVEVRPKVAIPGYQGLRVSVPGLSVTEEDVATHLDRLREQSGELAEVARPARDGDHLTIDVKGERHDQVLDALSTDDYLYELGSASLMPGLDEQLQGTKPGDIRRFDATLPGSNEGEATFQVLVKAVKEKVLPEVTDEWAAEASEFETVEELMADTRKRLGVAKRFQAQLTMRDQAVQALVQLVAEDPPEALVQPALEHQAHELAQHLDSQGATMEEYLEATGLDRETVLAGLRETAEDSVKADLALRALAEAEGIEVTEAELDAELGRVAEKVRQPKDRLRQRIEGTQEMAELRSVVLKTKAVAWLVGHVEVADEEGNVIARSELEYDLDTDDGDTDEAHAHQAPADDTAPAHDTVPEAVVAEVPATATPAAPPPPPHAPASRVESPA